MVRDMSVKVRIEVFIALGKIEIVSEYILLQTLSKKSSSATKEMNFPGQYTKKISGYQHRVLVLLFYMGWRMNLVRLQALDTMHHMAMVGHLKVQQANLHMVLTREMLTTADHFVLQCHFFDYKIQC
ncbi:PREDICTED: protein SIEL-like [Nicotiana attenuata]|uniref:protein SIEL-like n=1 Tax=Nicotiana attenuata TaxID=49451 RepID=UPI00090469E0|nr:PREDICTED: protein SIEL-like [Nicotiana attenuata]